MALPQRCRPVPTCKHRAPTRRGWTLHGRRAMAADQHALPCRPVDVLVVGGVSGCGKSTVARKLASCLGWGMLEGDDFHPETNRRKMASGQPLTDDDRWPWLKALRHAACQRVAEGQRVVVACSALKQSYRDFLRDVTKCVPQGVDGDASAAPHVEFVLLDLPEDLLRARVAGRGGHFMPASLLDSQLAALERGEPSKQRSEWLCIVRSTESETVGNPDPHEHPSQAVNTRHVQGTETGCSSERGTSSSDVADNVLTGHGAFPTTEAIVTHVVRLLHEPRYNHERQQD